MSAVAKFPGGGTRPERADAVAAAEGASRRRKSTVAVRAAAAAAAARLAAVLAGSGRPAACMMSRSVGGMAITSGGAGCPQPKHTRVLSACHVQPEPVQRGAAQSQ